MYYEARVHAQLKEVANAEEAAKACKGFECEKASSLDVITWTNNGVKMAICDDTHINEGSWGETAVFKVVDDKFYQVESITVAWCNLSEVEKYFIQSESESIEKLKPKQVIIGEAKEDQKAMFECGCCGTGFESSIKYQAQFDQDTGFGICKNCEKYYK